MALEEFYKALLLHIGRWEKIDFLIKIVFVATLITTLKVECTLFFDIS